MVKKLAYRSLVCKYYASGRLVGWEFGSWVCHVASIQTLEQVLLATITMIWYVDNSYSTPVYRYINEKNEDIDLFI